MINMFYNVELYYDDLFRTGVILLMRALHCTGAVLNVLNANFSIEISCNPLRLLQVFFLDFLGLLKKHILDYWSRW